MTLKGRGMHWKAKRIIKRGKWARAAGPKRARSKGYREGEVGGRSCRPKKGAHAEEDDV